MPKTHFTTPRNDGFRMPGEFEPKAGCWMLWPERTDVWRLGAKPAQRVFAAVAAAIAESEPITVGVSRAQFSNARTKLPPSVRVVEMSCNDAWMHDIGPSFVVNDRGEVRGVDWPFNAYGGLEDGLYFPWDLDDQVAQKVLELEGLDRYRAPLILEGGAIQCDGEGTLITTEECVLNPNRVGGMGQGQVERILADYLNIDKIIWLPRGCKFDETGGHIDDVCCFVRPGVVTLTWTDDRSDPQYEISNEALDLLSSATDAKGRHLEIHKLHQPNPVLLTEEESGTIDAVEGARPRPAGTRIAGSYVNYYTGNSRIVVPEFDDPFDKPAQATLRHLFPRHEIVGVPACREILLGGGNIKCITQPQFAGAKRIGEV